MKRKKTPTQINTSVITVNCVELKLQIARYKKNLISQTHTQLHINTHKLTNSYIHTHKNTIRQSQTNHNQFCRFSNQNFSEIATINLNFLFWIFHFIWNRNKNKKKQTTKKKTKTTKQPKQTNSPLYFQIAHKLFHVFCITL